MTYLIYKYTFPNGKVYIGQTYKGSKRLNNKSEYYGQVVYNAMKKYKVWDTEILLECPETLADWWETSMIKIHDSMNPEKGYNRESGGHKNKHFSEETRKKMSEVKKGSNHPRYGTKYIFSDDHRKKLSESLMGNTNFYGKHHSEETKRKLSENRIGKYTGKDHPRARGVYIIDILNENKEYYPSIKDIHNKHPEWNYDSIKSSARKNKIFKKRYKIIYSED